MKKKLLIIGIIIVVIVGVIVYINNSQHSTISIDDIEEISVKIEDNEKYVNYDSISNSINLNNKSLSITKGGTYEVNGTIKNGQIIVDVDKEEEVIIVLNGIDITCLDSSPIYIKKADKVILNIKDGSTNNLIDGSNYDTNSDDEPDGTIFSSADLIINGSGTLNITSNYQDAIVSKDGLKIINSNINIESVDDGIRGKDYVIISNANINIDVKGNGIKSTNDADSSLGYIVLDGGNIAIKATLDGIQSETSMQIDNGNFVITTGGGSSNTSVDSNWGMWRNNTTATTDSAKALKANSSILINNGTITIDSSDDAIHSNGSIIINNGSFEISSGDDGIHADSGVAIKNGAINITKSYEGIEGMIVNIDGGTINIVACDDGINVAGGVDNSSQNRPGANEFAANSDNKLVINGGNIIVKANGDGLDSNGNIEMTDGTVLVYGPTDNGNGALDYNGSFNIKGGTLVASGSSGMTQNVSPSSTQNAVMINFSSIQSSNSVLTIEGSNGTILTFNAIKNYQSIVISTPKLIKNNDYNIYINNNLIDSFTVSTTLTTAGKNYGMSGGGQRR